MRIIKDRQKEITQQLALHQVKICPNCKEKRTPFEAMRDGELEKGVIVLTSFHHGFFSSYSCYHATCGTCGTEWESDPF